MTDTEKRVEEIRERVKASSNSCAHDAPGGTCCGWCRTVTLLAAYDDMKRQRDAEMERAERAEEEAMKGHRSRCWSWDVTHDDPCMDVDVGHFRVLHVDDACLICTRILGKESPDA